MAVNYLLQFGTGDPRTFTGLSPSFLIFKDKDGNNVTPPGITEIPSGTGLYYFAWGTTTNIAFLADAVTTSPGSAGRYIAGMLDMSDRISEFGTSLQSGQNNLGSTIVSIGNTGIAIGTSTYALEQAIASTLTAIGSSFGAVASAIGTTASLIGDNATDPSTLFGYLKRLAELEQGQEQFVKSTGALTMFDRTGATTLATRTISNTASLVIKS